MASSTAAAPVTRNFRPKYPSLVMEVLAWPSWSAAAREERPGLVQHGGYGLAEDVRGHPVEPAFAKAWRRPAWLLEGSRQPPRGAGNTGRPSVSLSGRAMVLARRRSLNRRSRQPNSRSFRLDAIMRFTVSIHAACTGAV
jgi:hypothetical protein